MTTTPDHQPAAHGARDAFRADARDAEIARLREELAETRTEADGFALSHEQFCVRFADETAKLGRPPYGDLMTWIREQSAEIREIRAENARHVATWDYIRDRYVLGDDAGGIEGVRDAVDRLARERDSLRAECERLRALFDEHAKQRHASAALAASRAQQAASQEREQEFEDAFDELVDAVQHDIACDAVSWSGRTKEARARLLRLLKPPPATDAHGAEEVGDGS